MQRKVKKFEWNVECAVSFDQLKHFLTNDPVMKIIDLDKEFVVYTNAYMEGIGGFLMQEGHVVCYVSRKLNEHEKKYVTRDLELATVIHALKMWRHYLLSMRFFSNE